MRMIRWTACLATFTLLAFWAFASSPESSVQAQSGTRGSGSGTMQRGSGTMQRYQQGSSRQNGGAMRGVDNSFERKFWDWMKRVEYRNWAPGPGKPTAAYPGQSPHGAFVKTYLNRTAAGNAKTLPQGSIIVKENYGKDAKTLMAVTVMYRAEGFNPEAKDWYWVKYDPNGNVMRTPPEKGNMRIAGKFKSCIDCHAGAEGNDYSFIND